MHLVQISEHLKGLREMMGMVSEREEMNTHRALKANYFLLFV